MDRRQYHKAYNQLNKDKLSKQQKEHNKTEQGRKSVRMANWRRYGVLNVNDELYKHYLNCSNCEMCSRSFKNSYDKCLDHDHSTGEFRFILCRACNNKDSWAKKT